METKQKLKVGDKIVCITDSYKDFTKGKEYEIINVDSNNISVLNDYKVSINFLSLHNTFKLKDEKEELKPHSFCETPEEKCTLGYCDENGCMNRKRFLVESEIESVNHPNHYGGKGNPLEVINIIEYYGLNFNLGNVIKYCLRAGKKDEIIQELKKAQWYINREIERLENNTSHYKGFTGILSTGTKINTTDSTGLLTKEK